MRYVQRVVERRKRQKRREVQAVGERRKRQKMREVQSERDRNEEEGVLMIILCIGHDGKMVRVNPDLV